MNKTAKTNHLNRTIVCDLSMEEYSIISNSGYSIWHNKTINFNNDISSLILLIVKLNELGYKIVL